jgi:poly(hydroxyalkanoate) depolymerase family esterase
MLRGEIASFAVPKGSLEMNDMMLQATLLTRASRLSEATALIQRMLRGESDPGMTIGSTNDIAPTRDNPSIVDAKADDNKETDYAHLSAATSTHSRSFRALHDWPYRVKHRSGPGLQGWMQRAPVSTPDIVPEGGKFIEAVYTNAAGSRDYKLYIPSGYQGQALPLIVMLHGGTQTPDDFAAGTRMNLIAEEQTCLVVYPTQPSHANLAKCWNWFRASDQRRDRGEPSLIAGITRQVMHDYSVDAQRVYVGGLSAGAAAAAVMGATYPDLYAAIGVHSGLACGAADDLISAFTAMRQGASGSESTETLENQEPFVPTIVFHGDRDHIVHPRNADHVISCSLRVSKWQKKEHRGCAPDGLAYTRTIHTDANGRAMLEQWCIHGAGHAWSGGSPAGSYTEPRGPDATREMLRFFRDHAAVGGDARSDT